MSDFDEIPMVVGPPAESPIARRMEHAIYLHLNPKFKLHREFKCPTPWANFRIDLVLTDGTTRIGIECDGKDFHNSLDDEVRDSMILGTGAVDILWRFSGAAINFAIHDALYVLAKHDRDVFTDRGRKVLHTQACHSVRDYEPETGYTFHLDRYNFGDGNEWLAPRHLRVSRYSRLPKWSPTNPFWRDIFEEIEGWTDLDFKQVVAKRRASWMTPCHPVPLLEGESPIPF